MTLGRIAIVFAVLVLVGGGAAFFMFGGGGAEPVEIRTDARTPVEPARPALVEPSEPAPVVARRDEAKSAPPETGDVLVDAVWDAALGALVGRVVETSGAPIPELPLELVGFDLEQLARSSASYFGEEQTTIELSKGRTVTDPDGRFRFDRIGQLQFNGIGIDLGGPRSQLRFVDITPGPGETVDLGDIVLDASITFRGRVVDLDGAPVAGARVRASNIPSIAFQFGIADLDPEGAIAGPKGPRDADGKHSMLVVRFPPIAKSIFERLPIPSTLTRDDGGFELGGVPSGLITVIVDKRDFVTLTHGPVPSGKAGATREVGTLRLDPGEDLTGRVLTANGKAAADAEVLVGRRARIGEDVAILRPGGRTDANGTFALHGLAEDGCVVGVRRPGDVDWTVVSDVVPGTHVEIRVPSANDLIVEAHGPDGSIVPHPEVLVYEDDDFLEAAFVLQGHRVTTRARPEQDGSVTIPELGAGSYGLAVRADGFAVGTARADLTKGDARVRVDLNPASDVKVRVIDKLTGEPVKNARVAAMATRGDAELLGMAQVRTDGDGIALLRSVPPPTYRIVAFHPKYALASVESKSVTAEWTLELEAGGTVTGHVLADGKPVEEPRFLAISPRSRTIGIPRFRVTGLDGSFAFKNVPAGSWEISVLPRFAHDKGVDELFPSLFELGQPELHSRFEVTSGAETLLELDLMQSTTDGPTARLAGYVSLNGSPAAGVSVTERSMDDWNARKSTKTGADGRYDFGIVQAGVTILSVQPPGTTASRGYGFGFVTRRIELIPGESRTESFDVRIGSVRGRVVDAGKREPIAGASISLSTHGVSESRFWYRPKGAAEDSSAVQDFASLSTQSLPDGTFEFTDVPAGTFDVECDADGYSQVSVREIVVPASGSPPPVLIALQSAVIVSGRVHLPPGAQVGWIWLHFASVVDGEKVTRSTSVEQEGETFSTDELTPGTWEVSAEAWSQNGKSWTHLKMTGGTVQVPATGIADLVIPLTIAGTEQETDDDEEGG